MEIRNNIQRNKRILKLSIIGIVGLIVVVVASSLFINYKKTRNPNVNRAYMQYIEDLPKLKQDVANNPEDSELLERYAYALYVTGNSPEAVESYEKVQGINSLDAQGFNTLGNAYRRIKDFPKAIEAYNASIKADPNQINAYVNLAQLYIQNNQDFNQGIAVFKQVIEKHPQDTNLMYMLGKVYEKQGDTTNAQATYTKILELNPSDPSAKAANQALSNK